MHRVVHLMSKHAQLCSPDLIVKILQACLFECLNRTKWDFTVMATLFHLPCYGARIKGSSGLNSVRSRFSRVEFCSPTENLRSEFLWNMNERHHRLHEESSFLFFTLSAILLLLAASKFNHLSDISYAVSCCWQLSRIFVMLGERQKQKKWHLQTDQIPANKSM